MINSKFRRTVAREMNLRLRAEQRLNAPLLVPQRLAYFKTIVVSVLSSIAFMVPVGTVAWRYLFVERFQALENETRAELNKAQKLATEAQTALSMMQEKESQTQSDLNTVQGRLKLLEEELRKQIQSFDIMKTEAAFANDVVEFVTNLRPRPEVTLFALPELDRQRVDIGIFFENKGRAHIQVDVPTVSAQVDNAEDVQIAFGQPPQKLGTMAPNAKLRNDVRLILPKTAAKRVEITLTWFMKLDPNIRDALDTALKNHPLKASLDDIGNFSTSYNFPVCLTGAGWKLC